MSSPRIRIIQESEATGETAQIYNEVRATFWMPFVPDIVKLASLRPDFLRVMHDAYRAMFMAGNLPRQVKEMIATIVSKTNSCQY